MYEVRPYVEFSTLFILWEKVNIYIILQSWQLILFCAVFSFSWFLWFSQVILNNMTKDARSSLYYMGQNDEFPRWFREDSLLMIEVQLWNHYELVKTIENMLCLKKRRIYSFTQDACAVIPRRSKKDNNHYERSLNMAITTLPRKNRWVTSYIW